MSNTNRSPVPAVQRIIADIRHLRQALRSLLRTPGFTFTVVVTLALAIGANSAVFSAIDAVLLRPLPFPNGDQLLRLTQSRPGSADVFIAPIRLEEWQRMNTTLQGITGYYAQDVSELSGELPERLKEALVAPRFLAVLGVSPALGRSFTPQEERFGGPNAVLISDRLWRRRFSARPDVIGRILRIGRVSVPVVGVMPQSFQFPDRDVDLWASSPPDAPYAQSREATWFTAIGRLRPGITITQARANLVNVQSNLGRQFPRTDGLLTAIVEPLKEVTVGSAQHALWILFGSVSLLLLIACTNIGSLILARAAGRQRETSVRFSLGASKAAVAAHLLTEGFVLAISGAALGLLFALAASTIFRTLAKDLPRVNEITLNWSVALYSFFCAVLVTLLCGVLPAILGARRSLADSMAQGGRSQVSGRTPLSFVLVGVQVALAVTLLCGAGLVGRSFRQLALVSPGFDAQNVLTFHISTTWNETSDRNAAKQRTDRILAGLRTLPGSAAAASANSLPGVIGQYPVELTSAEARSGSASDGSQSKIIAEGRWVTPDYFSVMRIPVVAGELCRDEQGTATAMVNRSFVDRYFNGTAPLGYHLAQPGNQFVLPAEIRGVVGDARETGLDREPVPVAYWCSSVVQPGTWFLVRTHGDANAMIASVRAKIHDLEPARSVYDLTPLTDHISDAFAQNRLHTILLAFFACSAISLACMGLHGTLSYLVNLRRREMALRLALGALRNQLVRQVLNQGLLIALLGCLAGIALALASGKLLSGMLYGVAPADLITMSGVVVIVLTVSLLASLIPAVRAARVDPMNALRED